jgi:hypothetical protein
VSDWKIRRFRTWSVSPSLSCRFHIGSTELKGRLS